MAYVLADGASFATPHLTGAAALMLARNPRLSFAQTRDLILRNVDPVPALAGKTASHTSGALPPAERMRVEPSFKAAPAAARERTRRRGTRRTEPGIPGAAPREPRLRRKRWPSPPGRRPGTRPNRSLRPAACERSERKRGRTWRAAASPL
jgi:hypothetical protein